MRSEHNTEKAKREEQREQQEQTDSSKYIPNSFHVQYTERTFNGEEIDSINSHKQAVKY
jgi:hypothetical protein